MAFAGVEEATDVLDKHNFWFFDFDELGEPIEQARSSAIQSEAGQRPARYRYVLTRETTAPYIRLRDIRRHDLVDVVAPCNIRPVHVENLVAIVINLAYVANVKSGLLEAEVKPADAGKEGIHIWSVVRFHLVPAFTVANLIIIARERRGGKC